LLEFSPGINIIVGQNNSGKTALLEALTMNFDNVPHRSIKNLRNGCLKTNLITFLNEPSF
jgi:AAA15 family ATPase/GTPase